MIVACPSCQNRYRLSPTALGPTGRTVRCSSCGEHWFVEAPTLAEDAPPLAAPEQVAAPPQRGGVAWSGLTLLALLLAGLVLGRNEVVAYQPAAAAIYQRLGLSLEMALGLEFRHLAATRRTEPPAVALVVSGEIANVGAGPRQVPPIRIALLDGAGQEVTARSFALEKPLLAAGDTASFSFELPDPPPKAADFRIAFADAP